MEAICKGRGSGSTWRGRGFNSATILTGFKGQTASNFATIAPRSGHDRASIVILEIGRPPSDPVGSIPRRKLCNHGSIAPQSRLDRTSIVEFFLDFSLPGD